MSGESSESSNLSGHAEIMVSHTYSTFSSYSWQKYTNQTYGSYFYTLRKLFDKRLSSTNLIAF